jgi:tetratricopeptide (TPR) repeat protein
MLAGGTPLAVGAIAVAVVAAQYVHFKVLPGLLTRHRTRSPRLRRYLEWVVATPSLLGESVRVKARHDLMRLSHMEGLHEQAATQGFAILAQRGLSPRLEAEIRGRLADALEGLGRFDEAEDQRRLAESDVKGADRDPAWYVTRGRQLEADRDHAGACRVYEEGLGVAPPGRHPARRLLTMHLANALFMAGRLEDSARRAEEAVDLSEDAEHRLRAHRQAGASFADLGRLDEAEYHKRRAAELAATLGDPRRLADCLGDLAGVLRKRGRLAEALAACERAAAAARNTRHLETVRYEVLLSWGCFDEALAAINRAAGLDPLPTPRRESMIQGLFAFARAWILMEQRRLDEVGAHLDSAAAALRGDAKTTLWCDAAAVNLAALQGSRDEALAALDRVHARLPEFAQDRNTLSSVLGNLGRAALALGEYGRALDSWRLYLDLPPLPVDLPTAHYHLGECHRGVGDEASAVASYRAAVASGLDTHYARLAKDRLRTLAA